MDVSYAPYSNPHSIAVEAIGTLPLTNSDLYMAAAARGANQAAPGVNAIATYGKAIMLVTPAAPFVVVSDCVAAGKDCNKTGTALALVPGFGELGEFSGAANLVKEVAEAGKGVNLITDVGGGIAEAVKEYDSVVGVEKIYGATKVKTLSNGVKVVFYESSKRSGNRPTIAIQYVGGAVEKFRF